MIEFESAAPEAFSICGDLRNLRIMLLSRSMDAAPISPKINVGLPLAVNTHQKMQELDDAILLRRFAEDGSEDAFATLVGRHINLVYSVAMRQARDPHQAEDITQAVFIILARKAGNLRLRAALSSWLFETARLVGANSLRAEARRVRRDHEAYMESLNRSDEPDDWAKLEPWIDLAILKLGRKDRDAIALRYFERKSLRDVGLAMGVSEDAAQKRVDRALSKLRQFFGRRGVTVSGAGLAALVSSYSVQAAPAALASTVASGVKGVSVAAPAMALAKGGLKTMAWIKLKLAAGLAGVAFVGATAGLIALTSTSDTKPDPRKLLQHVADARNRIRSGELEMIVAHRDFAFAKSGTNYTRLKAVFDGQRRRVEELQRESVVVSTAPNAGALVDAKTKELEGDQEAIERLGLIAWQDAHYRTIYDGEALMRFDPRMDANIDDPAKGSFTYVFDPRALGISDCLFPFDSVGNCLGLVDGKTTNAFRFIGKEKLGEADVWRVEVVFNSGFSFEWWIDAKLPGRVLRMEDHGRGMTMAAEYDANNPDDPIPVRVLIQEYRNKSLVRERRIARGATRYNIAVDPRAWTLAGLGMTVGTPVVDVRIMRRIGYWNGVNLSEELPHESPRRISNEERVSLLDNDPVSLMAAPTDPGFESHWRVDWIYFMIGGGIVLASLAWWRTKRGRLMIGGMGF